MSTPNKIKVLAISHACVRAANRAVFQELSRTGLHVELLTPDFIVKGEEKIQSEPSCDMDPKIHRLGVSGSNLRLMHYPRLRDLLDTVRPNVVFAETDSASVLALQCGRWAAKNQAALICQTNENLPWNLADSVRRAGIKEIPTSVAKNFLNLLTRKMVDHVFTTSEAATDVFLDHKFRRVSAIPLGIDRSVFRYRSFLRRRVREELGIARQERVIAYYGRLVPEKGIDTLINGLALLKDKPWKLLLNRFEISSEFGCEIDRLIEAHGLNERVITFSAEHGKISAIMNASDLTVLPSRSTPKWVEQFGRVVPEAMACGNALVVSDSGAPKELIGEGGLVFREGDASDLARCVETLLMSPQKCVSMKASAMRHAQMHLTLTRQVSEIRAVVSRLTGIEP